MAKVSAMRILMLFAATTMLVDLAVAMEHNVGYTAPYQGRYFINSLATKRSPGMTVRIEVKPVVKPLPPKTTAPPSPTPPQTTTRSPTPPINGPKSKPPPVNGPKSKPPPRPPVTSHTPSSAISVKLTAGSILGFQLLLIMLLSSF